MIPTFRNEIEASIYAEKHKPLQTALDTLWEAGCERG
jgi:hypothetical protein